MERSESLTELAPALAKAQARIKDAEKSRQNPHLKSQYATLADVWAVARAPLTDNGLSVIQCPLPTEGRILMLETMLLHQSGQFVSSILSIPVLKDDAQGHGSAMTYARRYAFASMVGVCSSDDDAEGAGKSDEQPKQAAQSQSKERVTDANKANEKGTYAQQSGLQPTSINSVKTSVESMLNELGVQKPFKPYYDAFAGRDEGPLSKLSDNQWRAFFSALCQAVKDKKACYAMWAKISDTPDDREGRLMCWSSYVGREVASSASLTPQEWALLRVKLNELQGSAPEPITLENDPFKGE